MSFFAGYWLLQAFATAALLIGLEAWDARHKADYEGLSVANIMLGTFFVVCPFVNTAIAFICFCYFCAEIAPRIVFFKGKPNAK